MIKNNVYKKGLVFGIIILFVGAGFVMILTNGASEEKTDMVVSAETTSNNCISSDSVYDNTMGNEKDASDDDCRTTIERADISRVDFSLSINDFSTEEVVVDGELFQKLNLKGGGHTAEYGKAELPTLSFYVAVPQKAEVCISYNVSDYVTLQDYNVYPSQSPKPDGQGFSDPPFQKNQSFYSMDEYYLQSVVQISPIMLMRGCRIVMVSAFPFAYNPAARTLKVYTDFEISVDFVGGTWEVIPERLRSVYFQPLFDAFLLNANCVERAEVQNPVGVEGRLSSSDRADLLIVVYDDFYDEILPLAEWRHKTGIETRVVNWSDIGSTSQDLVDYMTNAFHNWTLPPSFLLIVGDVDHIPVNYKYLHPRLTYPNDTYTGTDHWYAAINGSDYLPEVHAGRISVDNSSQLVTVVNKILNYSKTPYMEENWFDDVLLAAYEEEGRYFVWSSEAIYDYLSTHGYNCIRHYEDNETYPGTTQDIINATNDGIIIANHRDHGNSRNAGGSYTGWSHPRFTTSNIINDLDNGGKYPVMFSINCESGWFDGETDNFDGNYESIGEVGLRVDDGFVAVIAATRISYSGYNDEMCRGFYDAMFSDFDSNYPNETSNNIFNTEVFKISQIMNYGKFWMYDKYIVPSGCPPYENFTVTPEKSRTEFELFHDHGDPTMEIWTDLPQNLMVTYLTVAGTRTITITVKDEIGSPINKALVCLSQENGIYVKGLTDVSGNVNLTINPTTSDNITILVTAHNYLYHEGTIELKPLVVYVDDDFNESVPGWGYDCFNSIQDGINGVFESGIIYVSDGTYYENVDIYKTVSLIGNDRNNTIIDASGWGDVITISVDWVNISCFTIQNGSNAGVYVDSKDNSFIWENTIIDNHYGIYLDTSSNDNKFFSNDISNQYYGIYFYYSSNNDVYSNLIYNNSYGIYLYYSSNNQIILNHIYNNSINGYGILAYYFSNDNNVTSNYIYDNYADGIWLSDSCSNNNITLNSIYNNRYGVYLDSSLDNNIASNYIYDNSNDGIYLDSSSTNTDITSNTVHHNNRGLNIYSSSNDINSNYIYDNTNHGAYLGSDSNNLYGNHIHDNSACGLKLSYSNHNDIASNNHIYNNSNHGIFLISSSHNQIDSNHIYSNSNDGIYLDASSNNNITSNHVYSNSRGIRLYSSSHNNMIQNEIYNNSYGIYLDSSSNNYIDQNEIYNNSIVGVYINPSANNQITSNHIHYSSRGIYLYSSANNYIASNDIYNTSNEGIYLFDSSSNHITSNHIYNSSFYGIYINPSSNNNLSGNHIYHNTYGMYISSSSSTYITLNHIYNNSKYGIKLYQSTSNTITDNTFLQNGLIIEGSQLTHFLHTIEDNSVNGETMYYYKNQNNFVLEGIETGQIILANCVNVTIRNIDITGTDLGIEIAYSSNIKIPYCNISNNNDAVSIYSSHNNIISNCSISNNNNGGVELFSSNYNTITDCEFYSNSGILLWSSSNNNITSNDIFNNYYEGILLDSSSNNNLSLNYIYNNSLNGITLFSSQNNHIISNCIYNNSNNGVSLIDWSNNNFIIGNKIVENNNRGISIPPVSNNNIIYHNNFIDNNQNAWDNCNNIWDNGYPNGGNYWSDFDEPHEETFDDFQGPNQNIPGSDGFVDLGLPNGGLNPYIIPPVNNMDLYPFISQIGWNNPSYTPSNPSPEDYATNVDINADLSWTSGDPDPGDTVTYDVYFGTTSPPPQVAWGQTRTTYDPGTMNYNTQYYWQIIAWDNHGASTPSEIWEFTTAISVNISLCEGWNLITISVSNSLMASTMAENITDSVMVSRFDAKNQTYKTYIVGGPPGFDFPIVDGYGYFVLVNQSSNLSVAGYRIDSVSVPLSIDWNMIGWYHMHDTTASSLGENISDCQMVSRFDPISQTFKTYIVGGPPGFDFTITPGMGLFVLVDTESTWHGEG